MEALEHGLGGERTPQARLYTLDGHVLLLGVTHANNTSLHVAEYRSPPPGGYELEQYSAAAMVDGERRWVTYETFPDDDADFAELGEAFFDTGLERRGAIGGGVGRLMRSRDIVDFAATWMAAHRHQGG